MDSCDALHAPARQTHDEVLAGSSLLFFALFHLNLAFSSIEESDRPRVIERCYWPLLALAERVGRVGIEATGFTLEEIRRIDPAWISELRRLMMAGKVELIGSGYAQVIGPLVPARVVAANLSAGQRCYEELAGRRPRLALINEQAYSAGLISHYLDAGYAGILMDWDNCAAQHPEWEVEWRYRPHRALGTDGSAIGLLWTHTVAFQKLQRYAHDDIALADYRTYLESHRGTRRRALCIYASDAEIFDFRPGRYRTEERLGHCREWDRVHEAFAAAKELPNATLVLPSQVLAESETIEGGQRLRLESASSPVPVKKQRKYNISRWAVTGRDDLGINAACERILSAISEEPPHSERWKTLCRLWGSDFRTHITEERWKAYTAELAALEAAMRTRSPRGPSLLPGDAVRDRFIAVETPALSARLDRRRGLALRSLAFGGDIPCIGTLPHGYFDDIAWQADWYTGSSVLETPGEPKVSDLEWAETELGRDAANGDVQVRGVIATPMGRVEKIMRFHAQEPRVDFDLAFHWPGWGKGSLRLGHVTLLPEAFDWDALHVVTHNGGVHAERFALRGQTVDHGAPVSLFVSASAGFGMTEGSLEIGDGKRMVRVEVDRRMAPLLGLLTHRRVGRRLFCQLALSALELDDTRKPGFYRAHGEPSLPRRMRFSILAG